jgi:hypothetical protein
MYFELRTPDHATQDGDLHAGIAFRRRRSAGKSSLFPFSFSGELLVLDGDEKKA